MSRWVYTPVFILVFFVSAQCLARQTGEYKTDQILVRFSDTAPDLPSVKIDSKAKSQILNSIGGGTVQTEFNLVPGLGVIKLPAGVNVADAINKLNATKGVIYAQPDYVITLDSTIPSDANFSQQWSLHNTGQNGGTVGADINAIHAWDIATGSRNQIVVAVIDTGIDYTHPDLASNMWVNQAEKNGQPGVDDDNDGYIDDIYGYDFVNNKGDSKDDFFHGTHCAGIIGAVANNNTGVAGVCWDVKLMSLKFLDSSGSGYTSNAIKCIQYAVQKGANVLSNSWGGGSFDSALRDAINAAAAKNILFVAAAGNSSSNNDASPAYPATYDCNNIISVLSTDRFDNMSSFSNYGATTVDIAAPGSEILNTFPTYQTAAMANMGLSTYYATISGTSMATPHVSGACALVWSQNPLLTASEVKNIIMTSVDPIPSLSDKCVSGGRLNIYKALQKVQVGAYISFDKKSYNCQDQITIRLADEHLAGIATYDVTVTTNGGDSETITLNTTDPNSPGGAFSGVIASRRSSVIPGNGTLEVADGNAITVTYDDAVDGNGNPITLQDTASIDCVSASVTGVSSSVTPCDISINISTSEPTTVTVYCTKNACGSATYEIIKSDLVMDTNHNIDIATGFACNTDYHFYITLTDDVGNITVADNNGTCYTFHTQAIPFSGSGTALDPYQIRTPAQLNQIGLLTCKWNSYFKLFADINMAGQRNYNIIGKYQANLPFTGIFDGNNRKISNLTYSTNNSDGAGLFGYISSPGQVKNVTMLNVDINAPLIAGGLVGYNYYYGQITNCSVTGRVRGTTYTGGLIGYNLAGTVTSCSSSAVVTGTGGGNSTGGLAGFDFYGTFNHCFGRGTVTGDNYVGGVFGYGYYSTITDCNFDMGTVSGSTYGTGGLIGRINLATIMRCYSGGAVSGARDNTGGLAGLNYYGNIGSSYSKATVRGLNSTGGLVGYNYSGTISTSYAIGAVTVSTPASGTSAGGLIGYDYSSNTSNCYAQGNVSGQWYIGGLAGYSLASNQSYCYSIGAVSGKAGYAGGLIAMTNGGGSCAKCYWNNQTSGQKKSSAGTGYASSDMMKKAKYSGWNFTTIWTNLKDGKTYPILR